MDRIKTPRLNLRPVAVGDEAATVAALNHLDVTGWLSLVPHPYTPADFQYFLRDIAKDGDTFVVEDDHGLAGVVGVEGGRSVANATSWAIGLPRTATAKAMPPRRHGPFWQSSLPKVPPRSFPAISTETSVRPMSCANWALSKLGAGCACVGLGEKTDRMWT